MPLRSVPQAVLLFALATPVLAGSPVFINELHYDNTGPDTDEAVEIAGPALTNLDGWSVVLYNGTGGAAYETIPLSGLLSNQCDGFGTLVVPATGIQNGAPDGLALVNGTTVVQFLSYEGAFTASNGPAVGMTSTNIGVSENGSGPVGQSLRLAGTGTEASDFTWRTSAPSSFGQCNPRADVPRRRGFPARRRGAAARARRDRRSGVRPDRRSVQRTGVARSGCRHAAVLHHGRRGAHAVVEPGRHALRLHPVHAVRLR